MHGRLKIKTTAEQEEAKRKEREVKLNAFKSATKKIFSKRANGECDDEALYLTKEVLQHNPDFYTLWNYRREILLHIKPEKPVEDLQTLCCEELLLTQACLMKNPKSYGAWHHRGWVMEFMPEPDWDKELKLCNGFLSSDERNFHCWDYRRFIGKKCDLKASEELMFTTNLIEKNFSNYSAWHYRSTLLPLVHPGSGHCSVDEDILLKEYELVQNAAFTDPNDQSVWFYHRWLLGRGERPLEISMLYAARRSPSVVVLLSSPVKLNKTCNLKLLIDGTPVETSWKAAGDDPHLSAVWQCTAVPDVFVGDASVEVTVELTTCCGQSTLSCLLSRLEDFRWRETYTASIFMSELSAATKDVLEKELESCEQLCELEPDNKWTLFTCVLLMRVLDSKKYQGTISSYFEKLEEVDHLRSQYYKDLRSKLLIENAIESLSPHGKEMCLTSCGLTNLHHFEHLVLLKKVNLSCNNLSNSSALGLLVCVEELILDSNNITICKGIEQLQRLRYLSLKKNHITLVDDLASLTTCPALKHLLLEDNPVVSEPQYKLKLKDLLKLTLLDNEPL